MYKKVSVIVPGYNHGGFLSERIESILHQTYRDFELILLDDASNDDSKTVLAAYASHPLVSHVVVNETNSGSTFHQWQKGLALSKGELIWIAESDDVCAPTLLEKLVLCFEKDPAVVIAFCRTGQIDEGGNSIGLNRWAEEAGSRNWEQPFCNNGIDEIEEFFRFRCMIPNASSVVFKKRVSSRIEKIAGEGYKFCGDWMFWMYASIEGKVAYFPAVLNQQRIHDQTTRVAKDFSKEIKRINEVIGCISFAHKACNKKINWKDERLRWVFEYYRMRVGQKRKLDFRYWFGISDKQFIKQLIRITFFKR